MKIIIYEDELYPYFGFISEGRSPRDPTIEVDQETLERLEKALEAFYAYYQAELEKLAEKQK